jgi:hypothetical protein
MRIDEQSKLQDVQEQLVSATIKTFDKEIRGQCRVVKGHYGCQLALAKQPMRLIIERLFNLLNCMPGPCAGRVWSL